MTSGSERAARAKVRWFHWALAASLIAQGVVCAFLSVTTFFSGVSTIIAFGAFGLLTLATIIISSLALIGRFDQPKHAAVFLLLASVFLFAGGQFIYFMASCASIMNCGRGPPAYHVLAIVIILAAANLMSVVVLWRMPPRAVPTPPQP